MKTLRKFLLIGAVGYACGRWVYDRLVLGQLTLDLEWKRQVRPLGPFSVDVRAPIDTVFDVVAQPYLGRTTHAMAEKLKVVERGSDVVLAEHYTPVCRNRRAVTLETVHFERPHRVSFRVVRGPVPHVTEVFELTQSNGLTTLSYKGELGTDGGEIGMRWGNTVAARWEQAVHESFSSIKQEAERVAAREKAGRVQSSDPPTVSTSEAGSV
jgi:polyketide cyclase/dehydrase/lipid transport protein